MARDQGRLVHAESGRTAEAERVHQCFRTTVLARSYSCLGARSAIRRGSYRFGYHAPLGSDEATQGLAHGLCAFLRDRPQMDSGFHTYVASFAAPRDTDEPTFERLLWLQLQRLHEADAARQAWDPAASPDPADPRFAFCYGTTAFFVVGLHAASSRRARRFGWPTLVFNPHDQFRRLREQGRYRGLQQTIRRRELALQGSLNPCLSEHGTRSEASQYSGRAVGADWRCPFTPATG